jgi:hypothetical protein
VIILGLILAVLGYLFGIGVLMWIGLVLILVGAVLFVAGSTGRPVGGRRYWY